MSTTPLALRLTEAAETDLAEIWATIATEASEGIATSFVHALRTSFEPLQSFPLSGPEREHLAPGLRVTFHQKYAIYYLVRPGELVIVRVIHGARDIASIAERGELAFPET